MGKPRKDKQPPGPRTRHALANTNAGLDKAKVKKKKFASMTALRQKKNEGQRGEYYKQNRRAFKRRAHRRARRNRYVSLNPAKTRILRALKREQTPFGPVTAKDSALKEYVESSKDKVQWIETEAADYPHSNPSINYHTYRGLEPLITTRVARMLLIELLETAMLNTNEEQETDEARTKRAERRQQIYKNEDHTTLRAMAAFYAIITFAEEQRTAGAKDARAALLMIVLGKISAVDAFVGEILDSAKDVILNGTKNDVARLRRNWDLLYGDGGPDFVQAGLGGNEQLRVMGGGGLEATEDQIELQNHFSYSSDDEESPKARKTISNWLIDQHNQDEYSDEEHKSKEQEGRGRGKDDKKDKGKGKEPPKGKQKRPKTIIYSDIQGDDVHSYAAESEEEYGMNLSWAYPSQSATTLIAEMERDNDAMDIDASDEHEPPPSGRRSSTQFREHQNDDSESSAAALKRRSREGDESESSATAMRKRKRDEDEEEREGPSRKRPHSSQD